MLNNKVKLVIWDLDETLWKGTLSEESVHSYEKNVAIINTLTKRGIINSICSKNDYDITKEKLIEIGIWDFVVFPIINWQPKGQQIKTIIECCQLRAENVLFIDDNHLNLEEAKFYNKGLMVAEPYEIEGLLNNVYLTGKNDENMTKLKEYKILEKKNAEMKSYSSNDEFLKSCDIKLQIIENVENYHERIFELLNKTNQLNFTKKRLSLEKVKNEFNKNNFEKIGLVRVYDRFGDYGIVGVFAVKNKKVEHFTFSCRILNLGIEQYIYQILNSPSIDIIGEVSSELNDKRKLEYITLIEENKIGIQKKESEKINSETILLRGGCDLEQVSYYLDNSEVKVIKEFNYNKNNTDIRRESIYILYQTVNLKEEEKKFLCDNLYFYDEEMFDTEVFNSENNIMVFSFLTEYSRGVYRLKSNKNIKILYGNFEIDITKEENWNYILSDEYYDKEISREFLIWFKKHFEFVGTIDKKEFEEYLSWLIKNVSAKKIVFITGSERNFEKKALNKYDREENRNLHHRKYNNILREFSNDAYILEVDEIIKDNSYFTDNIRHYNRTVYFNIAKQILALSNISNSYKYNFDLRFKTKIYLDALKGKIKKYIKSKNKLMNIINFIYESKNKIKELLMVLDYKLSKNPNKIKAFYNKHEGERCFIIGNGPSLRTEDLEKINNEISIASNRVFNIFSKTNWRPTYYIAHDFTLLKDIFEDADKVESKASFFPINMKWFYNKNFNKHINFLHKPVEFYPNLPKFSNDISKGIYEGYTVTYAAIQLAVYMGFKEIYLLGVDFSYSKCIDINGILTHDNEQKDYFDNNENTKNVNLPNIQNSYLAYLSAKKYTDENNIKIYNATRGGKLEVFSRIDFDSLF